MTFLKLVFVVAFIYCANAKTLKLENEIKPSEPQQIHLSLGSMH